jgi:hypothetical protein
MAEIPKDMKRLLFGMGARWHATAAFVLDSLGLVCLIMGIISSAADSVIGLGASLWLLLAIAFFVSGLSAWLTAYHAAKEGYEK